MVTPDSPCVLALAGGVGGAKLALGLSHCLPPNNLVICVNTGDDETFHGLHVSPDLDTMMYTLSGLSNTEMGWGVRGDTFTALGSTWVTEILLRIFDALSCLPMAEHFQKSLVNLTNS